MQIEIEDIAKEFGTTTALKPVGLVIPSGALVALLGPSGSGKTTLLRILGGLEFPDQGRILFGGRMRPTSRCRSGGPGSCSSTMRCSGT